MQLIEAAPPDGYSFIRSIATSALSLTAKMERGGAAYFCKRLGPRVLADAIARDAFAREVAILRALDGKSVPRFADAGEDAHGPFLLLEWARAKPLASWLVGSGHDSLNGVALCKAAFTAMTGVHEAADAKGSLSIVHGDLRPENLLFAGDVGEALLVDFALSRWREGAPPLDGTFRGTILYASPEAARGELLDPRSDLFSLAACILHVLGGAPPRSPESGAAALLAHAAEQSIESWAENAARVLPARLREPICRCVAFHRDSRPRTARDVVATTA